VPEPSNKIVPAFMTFWRWVPRSSSIRTPACRSGQNSPKGHSHFIYCCFVNQLDLQVPSTRPQRQARQQTPLALSLGTSRRTISLRRTFNCQGRSGQGDGAHSTTRNVPRQTTQSALIQPIASHLYAKDLTSASISVLLRCSEETRNWFQLIILDKNCWRK
jgi:hypothetical protein